MCKLLYSPWKTHFWEAKEGKGRGMVREGGREKAEGEQLRANMISLLTKHHTRTRVNEGVKVM